MEANDGLRLSSPSRPAQEDVTALVPTATAKLGTPVDAASSAEGSKRHRQSSDEDKCCSETATEIPRHLEDSHVSDAAVRPPELLRRCCRHGCHQLVRCCRHAHYGAAQDSHEDARGIRNHVNCRSLRRRCGCRMGEYIFLLIPRKPLSPGAAFLFSLLEEDSPSFRCAVDMGGTLAKLVFIEELGHQSVDAASVDATGTVGATTLSRRDPQLAARAYSSTCDAALDLASPSLTIRASPRRVLRFTYFRTKAIASLVDCLRSRRLVSGGVLRMTGGGAMKYAKLFKEQLGVNIQRTDEIDSIMAGLVLLASHTNSVFRFDLSTKQRVPVDVAKSASSYVRVTGTCIGGGTVLGLARLLFHAKSFRQVVRLSERGTDAMDLRVADLCGDAAGSRCIAPDALASSFGRLYLEDRPDLPRPKKEDIARSLIHMVSYNLGYLAYLVGTAHGVRRIFFAGKFINNYDFTMESITQGVNFYMQQYDQHTPQSCLRGPASPLLAAPPNFNVSAQQRILLEQQLLLQQPPLHVRAAAAERVPFQVDSDGLPSQHPQGLLDSTPAEDTAAAASALAHAAYSVTAASGIHVASAVGDVSPMSMPVRPQAQRLSQAQQQLQQRPSEQLEQPTVSPLRSSPSPSTGNNSSSFLGPLPVHSEVAGGGTVACWAPFEVLFLRHDGYLGAVGALVAPGREGPLC
ncbi:putative pantothenate kinase [Cyclospora cayetanensis]|uniref:Pantothenate kinase n=1 Tax=Cyclospora cayetanensis TaxID=88456 RepID=A0A1D3CYA0_9EIME|nr:putative pantothenate kinase [Cyclospora cayetanensis]